MTDRQMDKVNYTLDAHWYRKPLQKYSAVYLKEVLK